MVAEDENLIAEGWALYEKAVAEAGMGELPQLLRSVQASLTPTRINTDSNTDKDGRGREGKGECSGWGGNYSSLGGGTQIPNNNTG